MRTIVILVILIVTGIVAGATTTAAFMHESLPIIPLIGASVVVVALVMVGAVWKFDKAYLTLASQCHDMKSESESTGIMELDTFTEKFRKLQNFRANQLSAIEQFLSQFDRRKRPHDEDGNAVDSAKQLREVLQGLGNKLQSGLQQTQGCIKELRRATHGLVSDSEQQSTAMNHTTTLIEQLSSQMLDVCDQSELASQAAQQIQDNSDNSCEQIKNLVEEIKSLGNRAAARERKMLTLSQHTHEIESIVQTIGSLSSRTDLLALNASIESVRAGEQGRGFAVVAEEVRALAEQSAQAVRDISDRIEMMQLETQQSTTMAVTEHEKLRDAIDGISNTMNDLQETAKLSDNSSTNLAQIIDANRAQLELTREIVRALEHSTESSCTIRSQAEGANWTTNSLAQISEQLQSSINGFRLADHPNSQVPVASPATSDPGLPLGTGSTSDLGMNAPGVTA